MHDLGGRMADQGVRIAPPPVAPLAAAPEKRRSRLARWFDNWLRSVGMAFILFVIIKTFFVEAFQIPSGSMERTLLVGDFLFVNKAVYGAQIPGTHARLPGFELPRRGEVRVNRRPLREPYVQRVDPTRDVYDPEFNWQRAYLVGGPAAARSYRPTRDTWGPLVVPRSKYFVLGDNRDNSLDSRYWGFVDEKAVKGRPLVVYFSYDQEAHDALPWLTDIRWHRLGSVIR